MREWDRDVSKDLQGLVRRERGTMNERKSECNESEEEGQKEGKGCTLGFGEREEEEVEIGDVEGVK